MERGQTIAQYKLEKRLGKGGMGEVWLAEDTRLERPVAIKFISPLLDTNREVQERFLREAKAAAKLGHHPNVVPVHELGESEGSTFIVMDYVEGESLRDVIERDEGAPLADILRWGKEVADGLSEAHRAGITHRDIKPDNILLDRERRVRIADFGLARLATSTQLTQTGAGMGTLHYMSPEQAAGKNVDHRSDLFSLGATLYELLAGERPFQGEDPPALVYAVAHTEPKPLGKQRKDLPRPLVDLIERMLRKNPDERPKSAQMVSREFARMGEANTSGREIPALSLVELPGDRTVPIPSDTEDSDTSDSNDSRWPALIKLTAGIALVAGLAWGATQIFGGRSDPGGAAATVAEAAEPGRQLAIFPFAFTGADDLAHYARDIVSMLDFVLEGTGDFTIVKTDSLLNHIDSQALDATQDELALQLAGEFEANRHITGIVRDLGAGGIQIDAQLRDGSGNVIAETRDRADKEGEFLSLVDRVAIKLLTGLLDGPADEIRQVALDEAGSIEALKAFLRGETHFLNWRGGKSLAEFQAAAEADSAFALAHYRASTILGWMGKDVEFLAPAEKAYQEREGLPPFYMTLIEAWYENSKGEIDRAENLYVTALQGNPESIEGNYRLGILLWNHNAPRGRSATEAIPYLWHVQESVPGYPMAFEILRFAYFRAGDMEGMDRMLRHAFDRPPKPFWSYLMACATDDLARQNELAREVNDGTGVASMSPGARMIGNVCIQAVPDNHRSILNHYARFPDSLFTPAERMLRSTTQAFITAGLGKWEESKVWFDRIPQDYALHMTEHKAMLMAMPFLEVPEEEISKMIETLVSWPQTDAGHLFEVGANQMVYDRFQAHFELHGHIRLYLLSLLHTRIGEFDKALAYADELDALEARDSEGLAVHNLRVGARAMIAFTQSDFQKSLDLLDQLPDQRQPGDAKYALFANRTWEIFLRGLVMARLGMGTEALRWFQRQPVEFSFVLTAPGHLEQARIHDQLGNTEEAVDHYTRFTKLWNEADPALQSQVEEARSRLAALSS